jgi:hypothetical protein
MLIGWHRGLFIILSSWTNTLVLIAGATVLYIDPITGIFGMANLYFL